MKESYRKILFIFATVCLILTATNLMFVLHLAEYEHDKSHNPQTCPICQQALMSKDSAILQPPPKICQVNEISFEISYKSFFSPQIIEFQFPPLRAPPFSC